jgi:hypothetical protein
MIFKGNGNLKTEKGEPYLRSCWKCNNSHEHLKKVNTLHFCFECGKYWVYGKFLSDFKSNKEFDDFFKKMGLKIGDSTTKIDKGYRIACIEVKPSKR